MEKIFEKPVNANFDIGCLGRCGVGCGNKNGSGIDIVRKWFKEKEKWHTLYKNFLKIEKRINKSGLEPNNKDKASINEILVKLGYPKFYTI